MKVEAQPPLRRHKFGEEQIAMAGQTDQHERLCDSIRDALGEWHRFVIAIDGVDHAGKSTLARYLAWQLGMPAIETDLFLDTEAGGLNYRVDHLQAVLDARLSLDRPVIVEGVRVLHSLKELGIDCDFLVWVEREGCDGSHTLETSLSGYLEEFRPRDRADEIFTWTQTSR